MNSKTIGLNATQIKPGAEVYFYSFFDKETGSCTEGKKYTIKGDCFFTNGNYACFLEGYSGYVLISHLSFDFFPDTYIKPNKAKDRYLEYLHSESSNTFAESLGIQMPTLETDRDGNYRYVSQKYPIHGGWFKFKKDAKTSYKYALKLYNQLKKPPFKL